MSTPKVSIPTYQAHHDHPFGPAMIEHRTAGTSLSQLGTYFMTVASSGFSDPWTLQYEETIYVIEGRARIKVHDAGDVHEWVADQEALLVLPHGVTVQYGGDPQTRLLLSISPVNWRDADR